MDLNQPDQTRAEPLLILAMSLLAVIGSFVLQPDGRHGLELPIPVIGSTVPVPDTCLSRRVLGVSCPGCGLTRSFVALAHGNPASAFRFNPMGPVLFLICLAQVPYRLGQLRRAGRASPPGGITRSAVHATSWLILAGLVGQWVVKNLWTLQPYLNGAFLSFAEGL